MKRILTGLLLLACPAWADNDLPQFPKIAAPDPLPEAACTNVAQPLNWALGDWHSSSLQLHVDGGHATISGALAAHNAAVQLEPCGVTISNDQGPLFAGMRDENGRMYGVWWNADGKARRVLLTRP